MTLTMTGIKPEHQELFAKHLNPLLDALLVKFTDEMPAETCDAWLRLTPEEQRVAVMLPVTFWLLQQANAVGGHAYMRLLEELSGEVWARSLDLSLALAASADARDAGRVS